MTLVSPGRQVVYGQANLEYAPPKPDDQPASGRTKAIRLSRTHTRNGYKPISAKCHHTHSNIDSQGDMELRNMPKLKIMHWNAEGVNSKKDGYSKKLELENLLHEEQINVCCLQETHLSKDIAFKIKGYKCFRSDRQGRQKGGILTLVKNNITAFLLETFMDGAEYQRIHLSTDNTQFQLINFYCPSDRPLSLDTITTKERLIMCGDFNSHSQNW